jgi:hypothetical protein
MDSETQKQAIEVCFDGPARHFEFARDFGVVASLQQQLYDLLLSRT